LPFDFTLDRRSTLSRLLVTRQRQLRLSNSQLNSCQRRKPLDKLRADEARLRPDSEDARYPVFEAVPERKQVLVYYEEALTHDPKVGVKRKADNLRKVA